MSTRCDRRELIRTLASKPVTAAIVLSLRKQVGESMSRELLELASLQTKAIRKFGPGVWSVTARSIEQASDQVVADYKASLMRDRFVFDLCGGIGGDAMGFAKRGPVVTIDRDPRMTRMAAENLCSIKANSAAAVCADVSSYLSMQSLQATNVGLHIDPDRRPNEQRTSDPAAYQPPFATVLSMIESANASIVKLAPAAELDELTSAIYHRQWISYAGTVREQSLLTGDCIDAASATAGTRSAGRLLKDGRREFFTEIRSCAKRQQLAHASSPLRYIIDLDPAIRAAGLSSAFAVVNELQSIGDSSGFFTADDNPGDSILTQCFECVWSGPADLKQIRKQVAVLGLQVQVVKVRGTGHSPEALLKRLNSSNEPRASGATLLLGRDDNRVYAVLSRAAAH